MGTTEGSISEANKLELHRKLYSLRLKDSESVQGHIKEMTELFEVLTVIGDPVTEEDRAVYLLASLPDSFNMLVTALEASSKTVPKIENVTERLLHEEQKMKEKTTGDDHDGRKAFTVRHTRGNPKKQLTRHYCKKRDHIKRECRKFVVASQQRTNEEPGKPKHSARKRCYKGASIELDQ